MNGTNMTYILFSNKTITKFVNYFSSSFSYTVNSIQYII